MRRTLAIHLALAAITLAVDRQQYHSPTVNAADDGIRVGVPALLLLSCRLPEPRHEQR